MGENLVQRMKKRLNAEFYFMNDDWLSECIQYYTGTHANPSDKEILEFVKAQWQLSDLREINNISGCLPRNLAASKCTVLRGYYILQMEKLYDIATSKFKQLDRLRSVEQFNLEELEKADGNEPPKRRMLQLHLTDGVQEITAIEYSHVSTLDGIILPGYKLLVVGPVTCRRGLLFLEEGMIKGVGGEVEGLLVPNAVENILARALNMPENPDPYNDNRTNNAVKSTNAQNQHNEQNQQKQENPRKKEKQISRAQNFEEFPDLEIEDAFFEDLEEWETVNEVGMRNWEGRNNKLRSKAKDETGVKNCREVTNENSDKIGSNVVNKVNVKGEDRTLIKNENETTTKIENGFNIRSGNQIHTTNETLFNIKNENQANIKHECQINMTNKNRINAKNNNPINVNNESPINRTNKHQMYTINKNQVTTKSENHLNVTSQNENKKTTTQTIMQLFDEDFDVDFEEVKKIEELSKSNLARDNVVVLQEDLADLFEDDLAFTEHKDVGTSKGRKCWESVPTKQTTIMSFVQKSNYEKPPRICDFVVEILEKSSSAAEFWTIKAKVEEHGRLSKKNSSWILEGKVSDPTGSLDVSFSNAVLEELIGFSVGEFSRKKKLKKNPEIEQDLRTSLRLAERKLQNLDAFFELEMQKNQKAKVMSVRRPTEEQQAIVERRLKFFVDQRRRTSFR